MTYIEKAGELQDEIRHSINHSGLIDLKVVEEWNELILDVMYSGEKSWEDEYEATT